MPSTCDHAPETQLELVEDIASLSSYLVEKQQGLKKARLAFEENAQHVSATLDLYVDGMHAKADDVRSKIADLLKAKADLRRIQMDEDAETLSDLQAGLIQLGAKSSPFRQKGDHADVGTSVMLDELRKKADICFGASEDQVAAYTTVYLHPSPVIHDFIKLPANYFFGLCSSVSANLFKVRMLTEGAEEDEVWLEVSTVPTAINSEFATVEDSSAPERRPRCPRVLLSEFFFQFEMGDEMIRLDFRNMEASMNIARVNDFGFCFKLNITDRTSQDVVVHVLFCGVEVLGSPQVLSFRQNVSFRTESLPVGLFSLGVVEEDPVLSAVDGQKAGKEILDMLNWHDVGTGEVTRTGRSNKDLDESDVRAMGIEKTQQHVETHQESMMDEEEELAATVVSKLQQQMGPKSSPLVTRHLPLEQPSPLTPGIFSNSGLASELPRGTTNFTPGMFSTAQRLGEQLHAIRFPDLVQEDQHEGNLSMLDKAPSTDIAQFQRDLSGDREEHVANDPRNKSVSFHPNTTIFEVINDQKKCDITLADIIYGGKKDGVNDETITKLLLWKDSQGASNEISREGAVKVATGQTKMQDGENALHRTLLGACLSASKVNETSNGIDNDHSTAISLTEDSCWNMSENTFKKRKELLRKDNPSSHSMNETNWDAESEDSSGRKKEVPEFDLSSSEFFITPIKTIKLTGLPQSVSKHLDESKDLMFVTDVENNVVNYFKGWNSLGVWNPKWPVGNAFLAPRYILCLPQDRVVVLDNKALYIFRTDGTLVRTLFDGEVRNFRGLAYYTEFGRLIMTEAANDVINLVFIDVVGNNGVVNVIPIEPTRGHSNHCKVRFLTCQKGLVYISDLGMGQLYITRLKTNETITCDNITVDGSNRLKMAMGVAVDPAGNVLVASNYHKRIELFNSDGKHCRSFHLSKVDSPTGLCLQGRLLFVVDGINKSLNMFTVAETQI